MCMKKFKYLGNSKLKYASCLIYASLVLLFVSRNNLANGYEISIYDNIPVYFLVFLIIGILIGISVLIRRAFCLDLSNNWIIGIFLISFSNSIIILLPFFRGYFINDVGDELNHLGMIVDILKTGFIGASNIYPSSHLISSVLFYMSGLDLLIIIKIIPLLFYILYILFLYLLVTRLKIKFEQRLLVMAFSAPFIFSYFTVFFLPTQLFLYLIPCILTLLFNKIANNNITHNIVFLIFLLPLPFLHPLGVFFTLIMFLIFDLTLFFNKFLKKKYCLIEIIKIPSSATTFIPGFILFIIFFAWFSVFALFRIKLETTFEWFFYGQGTPVTFAIADQIKAANFSALNIGSLLINMYGQIIIYTIICFLCIFFIIREFWHNREYSVIKLFFILFFLFFSFFYMQTLLGDFLGTGRSIRIYCWSLFAATILNGMVCYDWISRKKGNKFKLYVIILTFILLIATLIGVFNVFISPHIKIASLQSTEMDYSGTIWLINYKISNEVLVGDELFDHYSNYIFGFDYNKPKNTIRSYPGIQLLPNLGYNQSKNLADAYDSELYLLINGRVKAYKSQLWPDVGLFTLYDLNRLSTDETVLKLFSNGELDIWRVDQAR